MEEDEEEEEIIIRIAYISDELEVCSCCWRHLLGG